MKIPESIDPAFASAMRILRMRSTLSQRGVAEALGVSGQAISQWEKGKAKFPADQVPLYLKAIGASEEDVEREMGGVFEDAKDLFSNAVRPWWAAYPKDLVPVQIEDESMAPWGEPGETFLVERGRHPRRGEGCLVEFKDGTSMIRLYKVGRDGFYFFQRQNPDEEERYPQDKVGGIHRIWLRGV